MLQTNMASDLTSTLIDASEVWTRLRMSLDSRRPQLQNNLNSLKTQAQNSSSARKSLAESTKSFKKVLKSTEAVATTEEDKKQFETLSSACRKLVKSYQEEIDALTTRSKTYDSLVSELYKTLYDIPDPVPVISSATENVESMAGQVDHLLKGMSEMQKEIEAMTRNQKAESDEIVKLQSLLDEANRKNSMLESQLQEKSPAREEQSNAYMSKEEKEELIELRREVAEYELEFKTLKNQDITIKKLNAKIEELMESQEETLQKELKKTQEHLAQTEGRRVAEALEREAAMARKLASLEVELKAERAGFQATQASLLDADEGLNEREAAWEAQRRILVDDADRLREQLHVVKRECDELKMKAGAMDNDVHGSSHDKDMSINFKDMEAERKAYEAEVVELTNALASMREELNTKEETMTILQASMQATVESLESEREHLANEVKVLKEEIHNAPSKEMIENMKRELRILKKLEYNAVDVESDVKLSESTDESDLETVLLGKVRKLESELVKERREKVSHYQMNQDLKDEISKLQKLKDEADELALRLESDLANAISSPSPTPQNTEGSVNITKSDPSTLEKILDPSSKDEIPIIHAEAVVPSVSDSAAEKRNDDHSVATIVMAQRDRLRARCDALEAERDSFKKELQVQVSTAESLKADNTKLYEKVRYLQSYNNSSGIQARKVDRDLDLEALESRYEASVDPFRQFNRSERQRKIKEMSPMERIVFIVARTVLGSKEMRTVLFFYVLGMHLLVFITTYH